MLYNIRIQMIFKNCDPTYFCLSLLLDQDIRIQTTDCLRWWSTLSNLLPDPSAERVQKKKKQFMQKANSKENQ
jgi:hypothetical protein